MGNDMQPFPLYLIDYDGRGFEISQRTADKIERYHGVPHPIRRAEETLKFPDYVFESNWGRDHRLYYKRLENRGLFKKLFMVVVVDLRRNRLDTGYLTDRIKKGVRIK